MPATSANFKQKRTVGTPGLFQNQMMGNNDTVPEVGKPYTILHYSDRTVGMVKSVSTDGKTIVVEPYDTKADLSKKCDVGHDNWIHEPSGRFGTWVYKQGAWRVVGSQIVFTKEFEEKMTSEGARYIGQYLQKNNPELAKQIYGTEIFPSNVIPGITKEKKTFSKITVIFGVMDYHYDWSF